MVTTITVNNQRNAGGRSGGRSGAPDKESKGEKGIIGELKKLGNFFKKESRTAASGILGGGGGLLGTAGGALLGGAAGLLGAVLTSPGDEDPRARSERFRETSFEKALIGGEEKILEVNRKTGEVIRTLTMQQAIDEGILNAKQNIKRELVVSNKIWEDATAKLPMYRDAVVISADNVGDIKNLTNEEKRLRNEIVLILARKLERLGGRGSATDTISRLDAAGKLGDSFSGPFIESGPQIPSGPGMTYQESINKELGSEGRNSIETFNYRQNPWFAPSNYLGGRKNG